MATKKLMLNSDTGDLIATAAKEDGNVYKKRIRDGYKHIGYANGFNLTVWGIKIVTS